MSASTRRMLVGWAGLTEREAGRGDGGLGHDGGEGVPAKVLSPPLPFVPAGHLRALAEGGDGRGDAAVEAHGVAQHPPQGRYRKGSSMVQPIVRIIPSIMHVVCVFVRPEAS